MNLNFRNNFLQTPQFGSVENRIPAFSEKEYSETPLTLSLSETFYEHKIYCTYEEYLAHYSQTMKFAEKYWNYKVIAQYTRIFKNIQIQTKQSKCVIISKNKSPVIHFFIRHPKMIRGIEEGL